MSNLDNLESWRRDIDAYLANKPPVTPPSAGNLPAHRLGVHWIADQYRQSDLEYMSALRPPIIKIVNPSPDRAREAFARIDPAGHVALRYHPISEQQAELAADPVGLGRTHAQYWIAQLDGPYREFDRDKLYVMGINEPSVHNAAEATRVAVYTESFLRTLQPHGIRSHVFNLSVGWPREENGRIIWDEFLYLESLINATKSYGCVHEYWYPALMSGWNSYANRVSRCPMKIPIVIGECAWTRQLIYPPVGQPWGWDGNIPRETYADQLWEYADKVYPDKVFAVLPFTTSYGGIEWKNKDTSNAHAAILARKRNYAWPKPWPNYGTPPVVVPPVEPPEGKVQTIIYPKMERITGFYGSLYDNYAHEGLDISRTQGTPVYAPFAGVVAYAGVDPSYGNYVRTYHPKLKICWFFAHLHELKVERGNSLVAGQLLGYTGNTGNSSGPHLHFEVRQMNDNGAYMPNVSAHGNSRVDPLGWLAGWLSAGNTVEYR